MAVDSTDASSAGAAVPIYMCRAAEEVSDPDQRAIFSSAGSISTGGSAHDSRHHLPAGWSLPCRRGVVVGPVEIDAPEAALSAALAPQDVQRDSRSLYSVLHGSRMPFSKTSAPVEYSIHACMPPEQFA